MAEIDIGGVRVKVSAEIADLLSGFNNAKAASDRFDRSMKAGVGRTTQAITKDTKELDRALDGLRASYAPLSAAAAKYKKELSDINALEKAGRINAQQSAAFRQRAGKAFQSTADDLKGATRAGSEFNGVLGRTAALLTAAFGANKVMQLADSYTRFTNQLKVAGIEGEALAEVQNKLFDTAIKYGVELEGLGTLYGRVAQGAKELGASQGQLLQFTNGVAAAIKIQGASAGQAQGALLQLSQALGGEIVRAEEFNSINEGARPILQAVANGIDRFGGSVAKLRREVIDGKVSSQEFFEGFLRGSAQLEQQAEKANLTIAASFTALNNALSKYVGEADKANGVTATISGALKAMADNVHILIPAITVLATAVGLHYVRAAFAATTATNVLRGALGLLGNVGIAAVILGLGYLIAKSQQARAHLEQMAAGTDDAAIALQQAEERAKGAGVQLDNVGGAAKNAEGPVTGLGIAFKFAADQAANLAANSKLAAIATANLNKVKAEAEIRDLQPRVENLSTMARRAERFGGKLPQSFQTELDLSKAALAKQQADVALYARTIEVLGATPEGAFKDKPSGAGGAVTKDKKTKAAKGRSADEIEEQYASELAGLTQQTLDARSQLTSDVKEQAELERRGLEWTRRMRDAAITNNKDYSAKQKEELLRQSEVLDSYQQELIERNERVALAQRELEIAKAQQQNAIEILRAEENLATTQAERREKQLDIVEAQFTLERMALEAIEVEAKIAEARGQSLTAEQANARARLAMLPKLEAAAKTSAMRGTMNPVEEYLDSVLMTDPEIQAAKLEAVADKMREINDLTKEFSENFSSAIGRAVGDIASFKNPLEVLKNLLADLASMFTEAFITRPVTDWVQQNIGGGLAESLIGGTAGDHGLSAAQTKAALSAEFLATAARDAATALSLMGSGGTGGGGFLGSLLGGAASIFGGGGGFDVSAALLPNVGGIGSGGSVAGMGNGLFANGGFLGDFAGGGLLRGPGTGRSDSIVGVGQKSFARFSNGEFITNALATQRHRPLLEAINANRLPSFAPESPLSGGGMSRMFQFGNIYVSGVSDDRTARRTGRQIASSLHAEIAMTSKLGYSR